MNPSDLEQLVNRVADVVMQRVEERLKRPLNGFNSTGIQDLASLCQLSVMDEATVVENMLYAREGTFKGDLTIEGNLILLGEIPTDSQVWRDMVEHAAGILKLAMNNQFFLEYADKVFEKIKDEGIELHKLTFDGKEVIIGNKLGNFITETNIQKLGEVKELTVLGEANIFKSLHVRNKRVGINTEEPSGALDIWDDECQFVIRKLRKNVAAIGTTREQRLVIGANGKNNIVLDIDGTTSVEKLNIGGIQFQSAGECPKTNEERGVIVFNENVDRNEPLGWVSLGSARWAPFGIIE